MSASSWGARWRALVGVLAVLAVGGMLVACGSDDDKGGGGSTSGSANASASDSQATQMVDAAKKAVEEGYRGTDQPLPTSSPKPVKGLKVWIVACTLQGEGCARPAQAMAEAARALGWNATIADGKLDPNESANQIRNGISAGADVIIPLSIACKTVPGALQAAKKAGVKIYGLYSRDCDKPLFDAKLEYGDGVVDLAVEVVAPEIAKYVIAKTNGKAEIINLFFDDGGGGRDLGLAYEKTFKEDCPDCKVDRVPVTGADIGQDRLQPLTSAALTKYPKANVVMAPFDGLILLGAGAAVTQATAQGRDILLTGLEGLTPNLKMIAAGGPQDLAAGSPAGWHGWAAIDGINRLFAGEKQVDPGIGYELIDKDHPPPTVPYEGNKRSLGWKENYKKIWGLAGS
jgi:ribose transport system substrate-binding protein